MAINPISTPKDIAKDKVDEKEDEQRNCDLNKKYVAKLIPDLGKSPGDKSMAQQHPKFPSFSDAISVQYDPQGVRGRYCVASRDIEPGELVAVETPFVWMLDKDSTKAHCWHCFRSVLAPVPCSNCAGRYSCYERLGGHFLILFRLIRFQELIRSFFLTVL